LKKILLEIPDIHSSLCLESDLEAYLASLRYSLTMVNAG